MQKFMKKRKARGFTLVELLIVIIIIGILAGALLLVAGAGTDKANATKVVSNLRNGKAAMLMAYADYSEWPDADADLVSVDDYMESTFVSADFTIVSNGTGIFLGYDAEVSNILTAGVVTKLELMAEEVGLVDTSDATYSSGTPYMMIIEN